MLPAERLRKDLGRLARGGAAPHNPGGSLQKRSRLKADEVVLRVRRLIGTPF